MSVFYDLNKTPRNVLNQAIVRAIVSENNGALFDPSDLSTLYQDAAGTTPVTAVEQPVGKMLDKSGNNWHATQSITASRPTLSARKNILLATETLATQSVTTITATYTLSFTGTGSVTLSGTATSTLTGNGTDRVSITFTPTAGPLTLAVSGSVTKAQMEFGSVVTSYQRVTTATDYDVSAHYHYLRFDGVDDYLNLPYMGLYANGSASVVAAYDLHPLLYHEYLIAERSASETNSAYMLHRKNFSTNKLGNFIRNSAGVALADDNSINLITLPVAVISTVDSGSAFSTYINSTIGGSVAYVRSGVVATTNTVIGASVSTTTGNQSKMNLYGLIITKSALTDSQRIACERFEARKSGVLM